MRVLVCGGTGFVGSALVPMLRERQHDVFVLSRKPAPPPTVAASGAKGVRGDLLAPESLSSLQAGSVDAIVLLAAPRIFGKRLGERRFQQLKAEITAIYANALALARRLGCPIVITAGTSFRTTGDQVADETWPILRVGAPRIGEDIDPLVDQAVAAGSPKLVWLLPGQIYGPGGMFLELVKMAQKGRAAIFGDGGNLIPRIHVQDCAAAYLAALEHLGELKTGERFIVADDVACTAREFAELLASLLRAPRPKPAPSFIVKLVVGKLLFETMTMSCRVSNAKAKRTLGWAPRYPSFREGLPPTVEAILRAQREGLAVP
ncbi:MAG TPA: NAD-dependent epimerase/dehydratase family protein [Myxococcales bacterium]|jgi:nucleoside-diphosphate-sugar epimerase